MSIINEAIKKARRESGRKDKGATVDISGTAKEKIAASPSGSSETKWTLAVVVSLVLIVSLLGSVLLYKHASRLNPVYPRVSTPQVKSEKSLPLLARPRKRPRLSSTRNMKSNIMLNGIVYGPEDKWAIINDRIVREGDTVLNGELVLIKKDFVKIRKGDGEEIVLDLR